MFFGLWDVKFLGAGDYATARVVSCVAVEGVFLDHWRRRW